MMQMNIANADAEKVSLGFIVRFPLTQPDYILPLLPLMSNVAGTSSTRQRQFLINGVIGYWLPHFNKPTYRALAESRKHVARVSMHDSLGRETVEQC